MKKLLFIPIVILLTGMMTISCDDGSTLRNGSIKWKYQTFDRITSSPAIGSDGTIYVGSEDGDLYAINPDGSLRWRYPNYLTITSSPALGSGGTIYIASYFYFLSALDRDGSIQWEFQTDEWIISSPAIGPDGTIYIGSNDHHLYAVKSKSKGLANSHWPMFRHDMRHTGRVE